MTAEATAYERVVSQTVPALTGPGDDFTAASALIHALVDSHEPAYLVAFNDERGPGILFDLEVCPAWGLGYLAWFSGATIDDTMTEQTKRDRIGAVSGQKRGRPLSMITAAQEELVGTKRVIFRERYGDEFTINVRTIDSETPDEAKVEAKMREQLPAHLLLDYDSIPTNDFQYLSDTYASFNALTAAYTDFDDMAS